MWPASPTATVGCVWLGDGAEPLAGSAPPAVTWTHVFTVCPKCALTLVVTAADLRVAQGYVRCGRCSSVFNALARLTDERAAGGGNETEALPDEAAEAAQSAAADVSRDAPLPSSPDSSPAADADEDAIPDDALEFDPTRTDVADVFVDPPPNPQWTAATGSFKAMIAAREEPPAAAPPERELEMEVDAAFLASMLRSEAPDPVPPSSQPVPARTAVAPPVPAEATPQPAPATETPPLAQRPHEPRPRTAPAQAPPSRTRTGARHTSPHSRPESGAKAQPPPPPRPTTSATSAAERGASAALEEHPSESDTAVDGEPAERESIARAAPLTPLLWRTGVGLGALLLLAQIVNHYRDELAATPRLNRPLTALYGALGVHLVPRWDVHAYDVRQLGASVEPGAAGLITVRASIKNGARQPQPLPLLRVTLQDRFGNRIASSDVAPRFYLPPTVPASSFLSGGQRIDAEMGFVDPGTSAVGFEIDACLPASGGGVTCANDVSTR
jgi:predicted Zn finger-like uncharacterized protein